MSNSAIQYFSAKLRLEPLWYLQADTPLARAIGHFSTSDFNFYNEYNILTWCVHNISFEFSYGLCWNFSSFLVKTTSGAIYCCLQKSWPRVNLIEISPFVTPHFLSYLTQYSFVYSFLVVWKRYCAECTAFKYVKRPLFQLSGKVGSNSVWHLISRTGQGLTRGDLRMLRGYMQRSLYSYFRCRPSEHVPDDLAMVVFSSYYHFLRVVAYCTCKLVLWLVNNCYISHRCARRTRVLQRRLSLGRTKSYQQLIMHFLFIVAYIYHVNQFVTSNTLHIYSTDAARRIRVFPRRIELLAGQ